MVQSSNKPKPPTKWTVKIESFPGEHAIPGWSRAFVYGTPLGVHVQLQDGPRPPWLPDGVQRALVTFTCSAQNPTSLGKVSVHGQLECGSWSHTVNGVIDFKKRAGSFTEATDL